MVIGGGGVGESKLSSRRTRIVDLKATASEVRGRARCWRRAPATRSPRSLPDDTVLVSGGSEDYRGRSDSNILQARLYDAGTEHVRPGRRSAGGPQLPLGVDPAARRPRDVLRLGLALRATRRTPSPASFEQRIEIYTPPYLYRDSRPVAVGAARRRSRGAASATFSVGARLVDQDGAADPAERVDPCDRRRPAVHRPRLDEAEGQGITVTVPKNRNLVQSGWYMLFVTDDQGTPSKAQWVKVP